MDGRIDRLRKSWRMKAPLEIALTILGYAAFTLGVLCVLAAIFLFTSLDEKDPGFPAGEGFLKAIKGYGIGLFGVGAVVSYYLGRWLFEVRVPGARRSVAERYEASRMATELAAHPDFQTAGSWEWRVRVANGLLPELREYSESDDWQDRRFAQQTVKEAWELYRRSRGDE
jgi:hypothetical protein